MLNYISAEWYKLRRTRGIFIAFAVLLALMAAVFIPSAWYDEPTFGVYAMAYLAALLLGFFLAPVFAVRAFDDQYGRGTLKNEIVFGIPRRRIYLGKLAFGALAGTAAAFVVLGLYLLLGLLTSGGAGELSTLTCAELCLQGTLIVLPLWLASLSLAFCLQTMIKSSAGAVAVHFILLFVTMPLSLMAPNTPTDSVIWKFFSDWFFVSPYRGIYEISVGEWPTLPSALWSWMIGLGWVAVTTLAGLAFFSKREIN